MNTKKINRMNKKLHNKLKRRMKPRRRQRKLKLKPENLLELKHLRNFWLQNKYLIHDFDSSWLYYFDPYTYKSTRYRNYSPEYQVTVKQVKPQLYSESENIIDYIDLTKDDDSISKSFSSSSSSSSSTDFSEYSFHSLSSMTDPLEDL